MALVISPSGNFYGSEQVLWDYLNSTSRVFTVAAPKGSRFQSILLSGGRRHRIISFSSTRVWTFYLKVLWWLIRQDHRVVYVNEGGHSRYIVLLAKIFKRVRFYVHVRILEDTAPGRWPLGPASNVQLISISDFMRDSLSVPSIKLYDLFDFPDQIPFSSQEECGIHRVAIIGRVAYSKGFNDLAELIMRIVELGRDGELHFNFYGDVGADIHNDSRYKELIGLKCVTFHGFVDKDKIYSDNDIVMHLSQTEPLGRIFFEAVSNGRPLIGLKAGGIGEISALAGLSEYMVDPQSPRKLEELIGKIDWTIARGSANQVSLNEALALMKNVFSKERYVNTLDNLLDENA